MGRTYNTHVEDDKYNFFWKTSNRITLWRHIKVDLRETECDTVD